MEYVFLLRRAGVGTLSCAFGEPDFVEQASVELRMAIKANGVWMVW